MDINIDDALNATGFNELMIEGPVKITVRAPDDLSVITAVHYGVLESIVITRRMLKLGTMHGDEPKITYIVNACLGDAHFAEASHDTIQIEAVE